MFSRVFHGVDKMARVEPPEEPSRRFEMEIQQAMLIVKAAYPRAYARMKHGDGYGGFHGHIGICNGADGTIIEPAYHNTDYAAWRSAAALIGMNNGGIER